MTLFAPFTPMLFMGEEYGENAPFQFFTDHIDEEIATATREGRRREFAAFAAFAGEEVPDPQDPATFERSKLTRASPTPSSPSSTARPSPLRRELPPGDVDDVAYDEDAGWLEATRGAYRLVLNFGATPRPLGGEVVLAAGPVGPGGVGRLGGAVVR